MNRTATVCYVIAALVTADARADQKSLELAKASALRVATATCPLIDLLSRLGKAKPDSPEYQYLQIRIDEESKSIQQLKADETEHLRELGPQLTLKEGQELNEYIDTTLAKTCDKKS